MIDAEISLKSLLFVTESLEKLIGTNGSKAVLRAAGQRAAVNLIEMLPLNLSEAEAIESVGPVLVDLGFIGNLETLSPDRLRVTENRVVEELNSLGLQGVLSSRYYVIGLFEGFFKQLSGSSRKVVIVEIEPEGELWILG